MIPSGVKRPVAVFAHPDDESLWAGGLLSLPHNWTVICCSMPIKDPPRAYKFFDACEVLGVKPRIYPQFESGSHEPLDLSFLDLSRYDFVLTHGENGEYGHAHHRQIHEFVKNSYSGPKAYVAYGGEASIEYEMEEWTWENKKLKAIQCYDGGKKPPQWKHLIANYGRKFDLKVERYC